MTDRTWLVGAAGYCLANYDDDLKMAYGGMLVEYLARSHERIGFGVRGLVGYVEATRTDDEHKNRLCPPTPYGNTLADWAVMNVRGIRATAGRPEAERALALQV